MMKNELRFSPNHVVCPKCLEVLSRDDIEGFGACPFCEHAFELDMDLEDFLLRPVVKQWMAFTRHAEDIDTML